MEKSSAFVLGLVACVGAGVLGQVPGPGARHGHELVYDESRDRTLLFGGFGNDGVPRQDTWLWNGAEWRLAATDGPPPRKWPAAAYDAHRGTVLLHGGREGVARTGRSLGDSWIWNGDRWELVRGAGPSGRDHHRAAYDRVRDRIVLFGGWDGARHLNDTWEWDGSEWKLAATEGPAPRAAFALAYHEGADQLLLFGGQDLETTYGDLWRWDGSEWHRLDDEAPGARGFPAMSYDPGAGTILLFGGRNGDTLLNDLWSWTGDRWTRLDTNGPRLRGIFASAFDRARAQLLIHGSGQRENEIWQLTATTRAWEMGDGWREIGAAGETVAERAGGSDGRSRWRSGRRSAYWPSTR